MASRRSAAARARSCRAISSCALLAPDLHTHPVTAPTLSDSACKRVIAQLRRSWQCRTTKLDVCSRVTRGKNGCRQLCCECVAVRADTSAAGRHPRRRCRRVLRHLRSHHRCRSPRHPRRPGCAPSRDVSPDDNVGRERFVLSAWRRCQVPHTKQLTNLCVCRPLRCRSIVLGPVVAITISPSAFQAASCLPGRRKDRTRSDHDASSSTQFVFVNECDDTRRGPLLYGGRFRRVLCS